MSFLHDFSLPSQAFFVSLSIVLLLSIFLTLSLLNRYGVYGQPSLFLSSLETLSLSGLASDSHERIHFSFFPRKKRNASKKDNSLPEFLKHLCSPTTRRVRRRFAPITSERAASLHQRMAKGGGTKGGI